MNDSWTLLLSGAGGVVIGSAIALIGARSQRRWEENVGRRRDRQGSYIDMAAIPLEVIWESHVIYESTRRGGVRLTRPGSIEPRLNAINAKLGRCFSAVTALGTTEAIRAGAAVLDSCDRLVRVAAGLARGDFDVIRGEVAQKRIAFLEIVRRDLGIEGSPGLPIEDGH